MKYVTYDQFPIGIDDLKVKVSRTLMHITPEL